MSQLTLQEGRIPAELTWTTVIPLPKGKWEYRGIELEESIWEMITTIIKSRFRTAIYLHDALDGFR